MTSYQTKRCVYCLKKPAKIWTGHVIRGKEVIVAGWCSRKCQNKGSQPGYSGRYNWWMGRQNTWED